MLYQSQAYLALLEQTLASSSALPEDLARWLAVVVGSDFPQIVARQVLEGYVAKLPEIEDRETRKAVLKKSIELLQPRVTSFEEEVRSFALLLIMASWQSSFAKPKSGTYVHTHEGAHRSVLCGSNMQTCSSRMRNSPRLLAY